MSKNTSRGKRPPKTGGCLAEFETADALLAATQHARRAGYRDMDAFSPFPVHGLGEALGAHGRDVPPWMLAGGLAGGVAGYAIQYFSAVIDYPIVSGGKPLNSWPAFIPVTFEMIVLGASLAGFLAMVFLNGLPRPHHPLFSVPGFECATRHRFFLYIAAADPLFDEAQTRKLLEENRPVSVKAVPA